MQIMPATWKGLTEEMGKQNYDINNNENNIEVGTYYLNKLKNKYGEDYLALMAYNWGPGNVDKWIKNGKNPDSIPKETKNYLKNILSL